MVVRIIAILVGIAFIFGGVAGFLPTFITNGLLFGIFEVGTIHNVVHVVCGVLAIIASTNYRATKIYFFLFGLIFTIAAILGFWQKGDLFILHINMADNILIICIGVVFLYLGLYKRK